MAWLHDLLTRIRGGEPLPPGTVFERERGERVLTWGRVRGGGITVATDFRLLLLWPEGQQDAVTYRWHDIDRASWADGVLRVETVDGASTDQLLTEPRGVPAAIREHVTASVVLSERHELAPSVGVRVVARRDLATGALLWRAMFDSPADARDAVLSGHADELVAAVRRRYGGEP